VHIQSANSFLTHRPNSQIFFERRFARKGDHVAQLQARDDFNHGGIDDADLDLDPVQMVILFPEHESSAAIREHGAPGTTSTLGLSLT